MVIMAIGQKTNLKFITEADHVELTPRGLIGRTRMTKALRVKGYLPGATWRPAPYRIAAVAAGREAGHFHRPLPPGPGFEGRPLEAQAPTKEEGNWSPGRADIEKKQRALTQTLPVEQWIKGFAEINLGYGEDEAVAEAARCINCGVCSECMQCAIPCQAQAVAHDLGPATATLEVGSVILAPGFKPFDPAAGALYGYGKYPNVHTSLEFERILSPAGPFHGHVVRRSDGREPKKIAWIHCVGSRRLNEGAKAYCSTVCCMAPSNRPSWPGSTCKDPWTPPSSTWICAPPARTLKNTPPRSGIRGARLIRSRVHSVEPAHYGDLEIRYVTEPGKVIDEVFDMVVLSVGMVMPPSTLELAQRLKVPLGTNDFMEASCFAPTTSFREGIFACGAFTGPKDIPQSVMEGSAAAATATRHLASARGTLMKKKESPPEREVAGRTGPGGGFRLQLRPQHRRSGRRPGHRGIRQDPAPGGVRPGQPVHLLPGLPGADGGVDPGAPTEPGGGGGLQPHHPPTHLPGDDATPASTSTCSRWPISATSAPGSTRRRRNWPPGSARTW